jgi:hypothetical protein
VDTAALNAFGIFFAALGATLIYVFAIRRQSAPGVFAQDVHIERDALHEIVDIHSEGVALEAPPDPEAPARREAIGFLGFLALLDGFFLQFIAALETMRVGDVIR